MSFSSEIKEELSHQESQARHCRLAEISAIISLCGRILISSSDRYCVKIHTENIAVARKYFTLLRKTYNILLDVSVRQNSSHKKSSMYTVTIPDHEASLMVLRGAKLLDGQGEIRENLSLANNLLIQNACCKRAFLRGAFLACGSVSDPHKGYHLELVCSVKEKAEQLLHIMAAFSIEGKMVERKKYFVVYMKEGTQIADMLNVMEAHVSLMEFENIRIVKEMRNSVNRQVNCETANLNKTVSAAVKQIDDIRYIKETVGFKELSDGLEEIATLRLEHPEATLKELGSLLKSPVGKSGVNHRLRKLSNLAEELRSCKEEKDYD